MPARTGLPGPAEDVSLPDEWLTEDESAATSGVLYVVDLARQFPKVVKGPGLSYNAMLDLLRADASADASEALWSLYEALLRLALQVPNPEQRLCEQGENQRATPGTRS